MHTSQSALVAARRRRAGLLFLALAGMLWGTGGLIGSLLARHAAMPPLAVAAYRLLIGGALLALAIVAAGRSVPRGWPAWNRIIAVGALAAMFQACFFAAVAVTSVSLATLVTIGTAPVLVLAVESMSGRRRVDRWSAGPIAVAVAGLVLLVGMPSGGQTAATVLAGTGLAVLSASGFAAITLISTRPVAGLDEMATTGFSFLLGGLLLALIPPRQSAWVCTSPSSRPCSCSRSVWDRRPSRTRCTSVACARPRPVPPR